MSIRVCVCVYIYNIYMGGGLCVLWVAIRIHQLPLCKGSDLPPPTSIQDMTLNHLMVRFQFWNLGNVEYPFIAIISRFILTQSGNTC